MDNLTKRNILRKTIVLCWSALIVCLVIKLLGGNYFEVFAKNETIINICNWIDGNIFKKIIRFIFLNMTFILYCSSIIGKKMNWKQILISVASLVLVEVIKYSSGSLGFIADCLVLTLIPLIFSKMKIIRTIIGFLLMNAFQIISLITRNISFGVLDETILVEILLQVDYYIMLILYYLYSIKLKGEKK